MYVTNIQNMHPMDLGKLFNFSNSRLALAELSCEELHSNPYINSISHAYSYSRNDDVNIDINSLSRKELKIITSRMRSGDSILDVRLGMKESLKKLLADDNDLIQRSIYTNQDVGNFLLYFSRANNWVITHPDIIDRHGYPEAFIFNNYTFDYRRYPKKELEIDPFTGEEYLEAVNYIFNIDKGEGLIYTDLQALLISKYGFYGGKYTPGNIRIDPSKVISLGLK